MAAAVAAIATLALTPPAAHAQAFQCTPETAGQLSAQANVRCECRFFHENRMEGTPAGYRWDCGILRSTMNFRVPATLNPFLGPVPAAVSLDRTVIQQGPIGGDITPPPANGMNGDGMNGDGMNGDGMNGELP
ncbi:MAG: hypothetical protein ACE5Q3_16045 [Alphaproteobacteria bacterium]